MEARAIVFTGPGISSIKSLTIPEPQEGEVLTRTLLTGVSTGTETRVLAGKEPGANFPLIPGYENVGIVEAVGKKVGLKIGSVVFLRQNKVTVPYGNAWGTQVSHAINDEESALPLPVTALVNPLPFVYVKVAAIALHGVKRASVKAGDKVAVVGLGLIGHLAAQICRARGAVVVAVDTNQDRLKAATRAGIPHTIDASQSNPKEEVHRLFGDGVDVAFDVTGVASTVDATAQLLHSKPWAPPYPASGRLVILGSYTEPVRLSYHESLFFNEPDIFASRDCTREDMVEVAELIASGAIDPLAMDFEVFPVANHTDAYGRLLERTLMRAIFHW